MNNTIDDSVNYRLKEKIKLMAEVLEDDDLNMEPVYSDEEAEEQSENNITGITDEELIQIVKQDILGGEDK